MERTYKDWDNLKPYVDKAVQRFVGSQEASITNSAISLLSTGASKGQLTNKLRTLHPNLKDRAHKLSELIFEITHEYELSAQEHQQKLAAAKRKQQQREGEERLAKTAAMDTMSPGQFTSQQIREMMVNAQKVIEERKKMLGVGSIAPPGMVIPRMRAPVPIAPSANSLPMFPPTQSQQPVPPPAPPSTQESAEEKKKKLAELQAQIQSRLASVVKNDDTKPVPLMLDKEGRAIDLSGNQLLFPQHQPTLKANIRAQKKSEARGQSSEKPIAEPSENKFYDPRVATDQNERRRRPLKFNEPGKYVSLANKERMQAQLNRLKEEIAEKARKTGISTAARLAKLSGVSHESSDVPDVEWWDSLLLVGNTYDSEVKIEAITNLIEHPIQLKPVMDTEEPPPMPIFLTKKERKKLRRQNRRENWKEEQEKIRLGLEAPPEPKLRISNLMSVLGTEAVQNPTGIEEKVRQQMAKRIKTHEDANAARKLTKEERKAKKSRKLQEDTVSGVHVCLYRVGDFSNMSVRFKVETNAKQLYMTGLIALFKECNLVVVEGGPKQQKKFKRLMMHRIKWSHTEEGGKDNCVLVWEGLTKKRAFKEIKLKMFKTEEMARDYFKKHGVQHYWDYALSGTVVDTLND